MDVSGPVRARVAMGWSTGCDVSVWLRPVRARSAGVDLAQMQIPGAAAD
jgi:hypothetical protein